MMDIVPELLAPEEQALPQPHPRATEDNVEAPKRTTRGSGRRGERGSESPSNEIELERRYGERGDFEKITVTLPSKVWAILINESTRRKITRSSDWPIAAIVREALAAYLTKKGA